jgi:hypothetical protein
LPEPNNDDRPSRSGNPVREIVLPLAVVLGLIGNAWWGGVGWGKVSNQLEQVLMTQKSVEGRATAIETRMADFEIWKRVHEREQALRDHEFRLFRMYTKGRIARLPYRASDDGE